MERQEKRIFTFKGMQVTLRKAAYRFGNTLAVIMDEAAASSYLPPSLNFGSYAFLTYAPAGAHRAAVKTAQAAHPSA